MVGRTAFRLVAKRVGYSVLRSAAITAAHSVGNPAVSMALTMASRTVVSMDLYTAA